MGVTTSGSPGKPSLLEFIAAVHSTSYQPAFLLVFTDWSPYYCAHVSLVAQDHPSCLGLRQVGPAPGISATANVGTVADQTRLNLAACGVNSTRADLKK